MANKRPDDVRRADPSEGALTLGHRCRVNGLNPRFSRALHAILSGWTGCVLKVGLSAASASNVLILRFAIMKSTPLSHIFNMLEIFTSPGISGSSSAHNLWNTPEIEPHPGCSCASRLFPVFLTVRTNETYNLTIFRIFHD